MTKDPQTLSGHLVYDIHTCKNTSYVPSMTVLVLIENVYKLQLLFIHIVSPPSSLTSTIRCHIWLVVKVVEPVLQSITRYNGIKKSYRWKCSSLNDLQFVMKRFWSFFTFIKHIFESFEWSKSNTRLIRSISRIWHQCVWVLESSTFMLKLNCPIVFCNRWNHIWKKY